MSIIKSKLFRFFVLGLLILVLFFLGDELQKRRRINQEIKALKEEIAGLDKKNRETLKMIDYFKTREFQERQARSLLNLQKEGEFAAALPFKDEAEDLQNVQSPHAQSNLKKWWDYFFGSLGRE